MLFVSLTNILRTCVAALSLSCHLVTESTSNRRATTVHRAQSTVHTNEDASHASQRVHRFHTHNSDTRLPANCGYASATLIPITYLLTHITQAIRMCFPHKTSSHSLGLLLVIQALIEDLNLASFLCPSCSASISCESTPIASFDCMPRLPMAAIETVSRASLSTNSS